MTLAEVKEFLGAVALIAVAMAAFGLLYLIASVIWAARRVNQAVAKVSTARDQVTERIRNAYQAVSSRLRRSR